MKKMCVVLWSLTLALALTLGACGSNEAPSQGANSGVPLAASTIRAEGDTAASSLLMLTVEELAKYNGKNGMPAYIAVDGVVYDVTDVPDWAGGEHNGYEAGQDLTDAIKNMSPHGVSVLDGLPIVGSIVDGASSAAMSGSMSAAMAA